MAERLESSISCTRRGYSDLQMDRSRVTSWSAWMNWNASVGRVHKPLLNLAVAALVIAGRLGAQAPAIDATAHRLTLDATLLRPGEFVYETTLERDASSTMLGTRTITVARATYFSSSAWLLLETRVMDALPTVDSLFVDPVGLRPMHWTSTLGQARLAVEFRGDTAYGATSAPTGRRSIVTTLPRGTFVNTGMLEAALRLLPLNTAWEDSASTLSVTLSGHAVVPTRLSVIGEDQIRVPAGTFDCWVVAVHADVSRGLFWVTKRDPMVVRSVLDVPSLGGAQLVSALTRFSW
jgi:hypothetical protein